MNLKTYFFSQKLNAASKSAKDVARVKVNMSEVKRIGILFDASQEYTFTQIEHFALRLPKDASITYLGFINLPAKKAVEKNIPFDYFTRSDVSMYGIPKGDKAIQFSNTPFDLLFGLFVNATDPLDYIMATSKARFRVGSFHIGREFCSDFMLNLKPGDKLEDLIKQATYYLEMFSEKPHVANGD